MNYASNIAAMNAARKTFGKEWKASASVVKVDGMWFVQVAQPAVPERGVNWPFPVAPAEVLDAVEQGHAIWKSKQPIDPVIDTMSDDELLAELAQADKVATSQASEVTDLKGKVWVKSSSVLKPTKMVWAIADEMIAADPKATRKAIQEECVRRGIASGTARTQYQAWKKCNDDVRANQAKAAELSARFNAK